MKHTYKLCFWVILTCCIAAQSHAQVISSSGADKKKPATVAKPKKPKPLEKELSVGLRLKTDGWAIFLDKGKVESEEKLSDIFYDLKLYQLEFGEIKHPSEIKRANSKLALYGNDQQPKTFIYGKTNNFYALKFGYGKRKLIAGKADPGTISIHWVYVGGLSIGLLKPYYVDAIVTKDGVSTEQTIKYSDSNKNAFLYQQNIIGASGFMKGVSEIGIVPGLHGKTALHFDFASKKTAVIALETGINAEVYVKSIQLMANKTSHPYFLNFYASIQFGGRK